MSQESVLSAELILERLSLVDGLTSKKMFGGHGIFHDGKMFGIIDSKGVAFFKADETTKKEYTSRGGVQHSRMPYYSIPDEILRDADELRKWAKTAISLSK